MQSLKRLHHANRKTNYFLLLSVLQGSNGIKISSDFFHKRCTFRSADHAYKSSSCASSPNAALPLAAGAPPVLEGAPSGNLNVDPNERDCCKFWKDWER